MNAYDSKRFGLSARLSAVALAVLFSAVSLTAHAEKPDWAGGGGKEHGRGGGKDKEHGQKGGREGQSRRDSDNVEASISFRFGSADTRIIREYYGDQASKGNCPPGLAKKGNGCQPPGQAKKWARGRPLPSDLRYYDIPNELRIRLPAPPLNHKYVQVAGDILLIAVGTSIVVDAMENILR